MKSKYTLFPKGIHSLVIILFLANISVAKAEIPSESNGIVLQGTRVIYPSNEKNGITFTVTNRTSQVYLLQSRVLSWPVLAAQDDLQLSEETKGEVTTNAPFIVLPPLIRFAPLDEMTLRIRLTKNTLPVDRESVFMLALKAIPAQSDSEERSGAKMVLALQNSLKLFYRPEGLPFMDGDERAKQLQFSHQGMQLEVKNPTPYYVTMSDISVDMNSVSLEGHSMIAPFSVERYGLSTSGGRSVSWQIIDDNGLKSTVQTQRLNTAL